MQLLSPSRRFSDDAYDKHGILRKEIYEKELARLEEELAKLQRTITDEGLRIVVLFEGRDAAGKGGTIKRITEKTNPRIVRTVALGKPSDRERSQWYFQRYVSHLPASGEMVLFDRSWYNRAGVERVMGFASAEEVELFMHTCPEFEHMLVEEGIILLKYWFSVSEEVQEQRFQARAADPTKRWKISPMDLKSRELWAEYSNAKDEMLRYTDLPYAPWRMVDADVKRHARLNCISNLLEQFDYSRDLPPVPDLPPREWAHDDNRTAKPHESYIDRLY
ncbi:polyphosphate kinase 2 [Marinobacter sp. M3C]|jgi:polyphosphate kinase 2|uniref:polyphosphate kinase 2 n=1 Tax=unclassified Marinobacter TaxID=83889 RepID=UPI00200CDA6F|nr:MULTISPECIES: polyphosphate kinase 2 [unclassified Marinobacter]MCL1478755.1 polyphosphate kinase 2 [Marinobacter sp.]MCL1481765.1 polyphosphate kinase 2 [Marinobacter sp.]MCL1484513.1 polyphosphate kinase 2 [Marinobacter sp.]UQG54916.1 polyphosphate kinase 2 [Marinobacter sp. M4C]UQG59713.1 polyphosphate kinase 2 [Marinobacter sp. M3C]